MREWTLHDAVIDMFDNWKIRLDQEITYFLDSSNYTELAVDMEIFEAEILRGVPFRVVRMELDSHYGKVAFKRVLIEKEEVKLPAWLYF